VSSLHPGFLAFKSYLVHRRENYGFAIRNDHKHKFTLFYVDVRLYHEWRLVTHLSGHPIPDHVSPCILRIHVLTKRYYLSEHNLFDNNNAHLFYLQK
jgi:hypothetical protein